MTEEDIIRRTGNTPITTASIVRDLRAIGVRPGLDVIVHVSLSAIGWICGGIPALIRGLQDTVTADGTIVMPAHSGDVSDPAGWAHPPVPASWVEIIRAQMPAFDPKTTPTRGIGRTPELFRTMPGVLRSAHPALSFAAWGRRATAFTSNHKLDDPLGEDGPIGRLYAANGSILLIGVDHGANTSLHLAEHRWSGAIGRSKTDYAPIQGLKGRSWTGYQTLDYNDDDFARVGSAFEEAHPKNVLLGTVGIADARLIPLRAAVDFAQRWMEENRPRP